MLTRRIGVVGGIAVATLAISGFAAARQEKSGTAAPPEPGARVDLPAWIAGSWLAEDGGGRTEEQWFAPAAETMVGMCRITRGNKLGMYEFMVIEREAASVVMWMRHYRWNMKEREQAPIRWVLTKSGDGEAVFEGPTEERFKNLVYRKTGPDSMTTTLVPRDPAAMKQLEFTFRRVGPDQGKP